MEAITTRKYEWLVFCMSLIAISYCDNALDDDFSELPEVVRKVLDMWANPNEETISVLVAMRDQQDAGRRNAT